MRPKLNPGDVVLVMHCEIYPTVEEAVAAAAEIGLTKGSTLILRVKETIPWPP
jgi:hypothetical protein